MEFGLESEANVTEESIDDDFLMELGIHGLFSWVNRVFEVHLEACFLLLGSADHVSERIDYT